MQKDNTVEKLIGKRIQKLRKEKGLTQQQFAEMIDLSTNYVSDVERGKSSIRLSKLVTVMNALECSADEIFAAIKSRYLGYLNRWRLYQKKTVRRSIRL